MPICPDTALEKRWTLLSRGALAAIVGGFRRSPWRPEIVPSYGNRWALAG